MKFAIIIEKAGKNFCAFSPDVPGCVATGDSPEELLRSFPQTLRGHFQALKKLGGQLPLPTTLADMVEVEVEDVA